MEEDLVSQGSDSEKRKGAGGESLPLSSFLYECLPYCLSIGMTRHEYWEEDGDLVVYYRKAEELRQEKANWLAHLQGMYIYEAICDASPIFNPFAKRGTKPVPYPMLPYGVQGREAVNKDEQTRKAMDVFSAWAIRHNQRKEKEDAGLGIPEVQSRSADGFDDSETERAIESRGATEE